MTHPPTRVQPGEPEAARGGNRERSWIRSHSGPRVISQRPDTLRTPPQRERLLERQVNLSRRMERADLAVDPFAVDQPYRVRVIRQAGLHYTVMPEFRTGIALTM